MSIKFSRKPHEIYSHDAGEFVGIYLWGVHEMDEARDIARKYLENYVRSYPSMQLKYIDKNNYKMKVKYKYLRIEETGKTREKQYFCNTYYKGTKMVTLVLYD